MAMIRDTTPDQSALSRVGATVRARLDGDPAAWKVPVEAAELYAVAQFLSPAECARFMAMVDAVARPSHVFDYARDAAYRTSYSGDVTRDDPFVQMIERRIDDLLGIDPSFGEIIQGQRYTPGQEFKGHWDWFVTTEDYWPGQQACGGQRSWTAMIYLNDVAEGGQTVFTHLGATIPPQQGTLLAWNNMKPDGTPNPATLHAATPPVDGTKYVITKWYRARPWL
ncbi:MAG: 2OG-Fe(II) oxygenase [Sphingomonadales bacterium]|nr:2OG-Fe(II) oxygenase [Sphingomonadales bacterium]